MLCSVNLLPLGLLVAIASTTASAEEAYCTKGIPLPTGFNGSEWPRLFRLDGPYPENPMAANFDNATTSGATVDPSVLASAGVTYQYIDPTGFDYPNATASVPWFPPEGGTNDPRVQSIRDRNDYQYADIIVVNAFIGKFWDEHLHEATTIRYMLDGTGYFDLRDANDEWVRIPVSAGDWFEWPAGIDHRFTVDDTNSYVQAMRLYKGSGSPEWAAVPRASVYGNNTARNGYVEKYLCGIDPDYDPSTHNDGDGNGTGDSNETSLILDDDGGGGGGYDVTEDLRTCEANPGCSDLRLVGACCPATGGTMMSCCEDYLDPSSGGAGGLGRSFLVLGGIATAFVLLAATVIA